MKVAALFAGIGGIEVGLGRVGHHAELLCEIDDGAIAVLEKHFPGVPMSGDVREIRSLPRNIELLTAGFPCQDLSQAGKTVGITGDRSGLVGEVFRLLRQRRVPWVLIENVPFMLQLGRGQALEVIINEFEALGYRWAYRVVDTLSFGLPQRRHRVYFLASIESDPRDVLLADDAGEPESPQPSRRRSFGFYWTEGVGGLGAAVELDATGRGVSPTSPRFECIAGGAIRSGTDQLRAFPAMRA